MKVYVEIVLLTVVVVASLSMLNPTFGTFIGERLGYVAGVTFVIAGALSPFLVVGFLLWLLIFRKKRPANTYAAAPKDDLLKPSESNAIALISPEDSNINVINNSQKIAANSNRYGDPITKSGLCNLDTLDIKSTKNIVPPELAPQFSKALKVIEYSPDAATAWNNLQSLPDKYRTSFLDALEDNPNEDAAQLASRLSSEHHRELRPYDTEDANEALEQARTISPEAEEEFKTVYKLVGESVDAHDILSKIENKFGPSEATQRRLAAERLDRERLKLMRIDKEQLETERLELLRQKRLEEERKQERKFGVGVVISTFILLIILIIISVP